MNEQVHYNRFPMRIASIMPEMVKENFDHNQEYHDDTKRTLFSVVGNSDDEDNDDDDERRRRHFPRNSDEEEGEEGLFVIKAKKSAMNVEIGKRKGQKRNYASA
eukprot:jgi/Bigna1/129078/aug1.8_g3786